MYLFGASGHAKVIIDILKRNEISVLGIFDDDLSKKELAGIKVLGNDSAYSASTNPCIISIGNNKIRKKITLQIQAKYTKAIHPSSVIANSVTIDEGTVVMAGVIINSDTQIGKHCIVNTASSIDHDCIIEDFVHISPNACLCGGITVGEGTHIGAGATIIPNLKIGKWATIGAGAVVIRDVPDGVLLVGNPAKIIKHIQLQ